MSLKGFERAKPNLQPSLNPFLDVLDAYLKILSGL